MKQTTRNLFLDILIFREMYDLKLKIYIKSTNKNDLKFLFFLQQNEIWNAYTNFSFNSKAQIFIRVTHTYT